MSLRTTITGSGWTQIGTGPATVQLISPDANGVEVMVACQSAAPATNSDGIVLNSVYPVQLMSPSLAIWTQTIQPALTATLAVQPQVFG